MGRLDNRVALVTGAGRGLGEGIARALAAEGATVVCADVLDAGPVAAALPHAKAISLDVTDVAAVDAAVAGIVGEFGSVEILVNNAGVAQPIGTFLETSDETIDRVLAVNVKGVVYCSRAAARAMIERGRGGRIVNTASQVGKVAWPNWGIYSASKAAVIGITQAMAVELAPHRITVNAICPGTMDTNMTRTGFGEAASSQGVDRDELIAQHASTIPLGRLGTPEDIGRMCAWIASDECSFTTGAAFNLTGGENVFF